MQDIWGHPCVGAPHGPPSRGPAPLGPAAPAPAQLRRPSRAPSSRRSCGRVMRPWVVIDCLAVARGAAAVEAARGACLLAGPLGDRSRRYVRRTVIVRWVPYHRPRPDPSFESGLWDWLGNIVAGDASAAAGRAGPPWWTVAHRRRGVDLALRVHSLFPDVEFGVIAAHRAGRSAVFVPRRRRRAASPTRRWRQRQSRAAARGGAAPNRSYSAHRTRRKLRSPARRARGV